MIRYWKSKSKSTSYLINYPIVIITIISGYFCYRSERLIISNITMNIFTRPSNFSAFDTNIFN